MAQDVTSQNVRQEQRIFGIGYERLAPMMARIVQGVTGTTPTALGDGYWVVETGKGSARRSIDVRLGRESADTRISVRVETFIDLKMILLVVGLGIVTAGIGVLPLIPWLSNLTRKQAQDRDLLLHQMFRAIEDAVADQGASSHYRVAPGAVDSATSLDEPAAEEGEPMRRRDGR